MLLDVASNHAGEGNKTCIARNNGSGVYFEVFYCLQNVSFWEYLRWVSNMTDA